MPRWTVAPRSLDVCRPSFVAKSHIWCNLERGRHSPIDPHDHRKGFADNASPRKPRRNTATLEIERVLELEAVPDPQIEIGFDVIDVADDQTACHPLVASL